MRSPNDVAPHVHQLAARIGSRLNEQDAWRIVVSLVYARWAAREDRARESSRPSWRWLTDRTDKDPRVGPYVRGFLSEWLHQQTAADESERGKGNVPSLPATVDSDLRQLIRVIDRAEGLGDLLQHCLRNLSDSQATGGHYFTPRDIARLMVEAVEPRDTHRILDPACGSAGLLIEAVLHMRRHTTLDVRPSLTGQDLHAGTLQIARMNLDAHGVKADLAPPMDSLAEPTSEGFDVVLANPPFNAASWAPDGTLDDDDPRWSRYTRPRRGDANFAWILHIAHALAPGGRAAVLMADGAADNIRKADRVIREGLVTDDLVECVVALPPGLFPHVRIPCCLWLLNRDKSPQGVGGVDRNREVLFINARGASEQIGNSRRWRLDPDGIERILHTLAIWRGVPRSAPLQEVDAYGDEPGWCRSRTLQELADGGYNLLPPNHTDAPGDANGSSQQRIVELTGELYKRFEEARDLEAKLRRALDEL
ncbi:HsdM family class I SAM-dependent methyltransferase [Nocardiopsis rhodophaea]|uniref:HsdM family class I SAM-dependent methyltransferase n=1 Tax=Nocardiopsis rhodophaea TaxID=280238 RepID=UPI0031DA82CE